MERGPLVLEGWLTARFAISGRPAADQAVLTGGEQFLAVLPEDRMADGLGVRHAFADLIACCAIANEDGQLRGGHSCRATRHHEVLAVVSEDDGANRGSVFPRG